MCETSETIERTPRLMAVLIEIRRTVKQLVREVHAPQGHNLEEAHGAPSNARHA